MIEKLKAEFAKLFDAKADKNIFFAPGSFNLIGDHIDYNGGKVFPTTINLGTYAAAIKRDDNIIRFRSLNYSTKIDISLENISFNKKHNWANYPKAILAELIKSNYSVNNGFDILYYSNLPSGIGLSSTASIEIVTAFLLNDLFNLKMPRLELVKLCQKAENEYLKLNNGILNKFAIGMGKKNQGIYLDTKTLKYEYIPLKLQNHKFIIANTNKTYPTTNTVYNERYRECQQALEVMQTKIKVDNLCAISPIDFENHKDLIKDGILARRAWHVIYENQRTFYAVEFMKTYDLKAFGQLLNQSQMSLKRDFEITGFELDTIIETAWNQRGLIGSKMIGKGMGGCSINLVKANFVDDFIKNVGKVYKEKTNLTANFYILESSTGAEKIS